MSLSDALWEDLENISLPSLPFQLQFPDSDSPVPFQCEDEADLLPVLHLDSDLELSLAQSCDLVSGASTDQILRDHVNRLEVSNQMSRLHVMVCGSCHQVFHFIDQFISHTHFCQGPAPPLETVNKDEGIDNTMEALAVILWTRTIIKTVREQGVTNSHLDENILTKRIRNMWFSLTDNFKEAWMRGAEVLMRISHFGEIMLDDDRKDKDANTKVPPPSPPKSVIHNPPKHDKIRKEVSYYSHRDTKGRWASKDVIQKTKEFKCKTCNFEASSEWKLKRHESTKKHLELCELRAEALETTEILNSLVDEIEEFDVLENVNEKEFLHSSPCDIIMKDS